MTKNFKLSSSFKYKLLQFYQLNKFYYLTSKQVPFIAKITISFNQKSHDFKQILSTHLALKLLFYQKSNLIKTTKSNLNYKTKKGQPVGSKITINNKNKGLKILNLLFNIIKINKNFTNLNCNKNQLNVMTFSILEIYNIKELENFYLLFNKLKNLNVSINIFSLKKNFFSEFSFLIKLNKNLLHL